MGWGVGMLPTDMRDLKDKARVSGRRVSRERTNTGQGGAEPRIQSGYSSHEQGTEVSWGQPRLDPQGNSRPLAEIRQGMHMNPIHRGLTQDFAT